MGFARLSVGSVLGTAGGVLLLLAVLVGGAPASTPSEGGGTPAGNATAEGGASAATSPGRPAGAAQAAPEYPTPTTPDYETPTSPEPAAPEEQPADDERRDDGVGVPDNESGAAPQPGSRGEAAHPPTGFEALIAAGAGLALLGLGLTARRRMAA